MFLTEAANRGSISTGYDVDNSLKLESDNTERVNKAAGTISGAGNRRTFTISFWTKRTEINGVKQYLFEAGNSDSNTDRFTLRFGTGDTFDIQSQNTWLITNRKFRDISAWYHFVIKVDTTDGTAGNRIKLYVNGVEETSFSTDNRSSINQNHDFPVNNTEDHIIGNSQIEGSLYYNGYIAEWIQLDGTAAAPTEFGEVDSASGVWKPKDPSELSFGTNGFWLDFEDSSNLGNDASGGTDFTLTNVAAADQATDTPTNNFCTLNPLIPYAVQSGAPVISNGATFHNGSGGWTGMKGTIGINKGKWYWELSMGGAGGGVSVIYGIQTVTSASGESTATSAHNLLETAAWYVNGGHWIKDETSGRDDVAAGSVTHTPGNTVVYAVALNMDEGEITYYANGSAITNLTDLDLDGLDGETVAPFASVYNQQLAWNLGGYTTLSISSAASDENGYGTFEYAPPSGYYAICTKNLAEYG